MYLFFKYSLYFFGVSFLESGTGGCSDDDDDDDDDDDINESPGATVVVDSVDFVESFCADCDGIIIDGSMDSIESFWSGRKLILIKITHNSAASKYLK